MEELKKEIEQALLKYRKGIEWLFDGKEDSPVPKMEDVLSHNATLETILALFKTKMEGIIGQCAKEQSCSMCKEALGKEIE